MISITRYRGWPDGAVQEADTPAHHWKSDDYELVEAPTPEDAWARAKANAPMVPELNYAAICDAAFLQDKRWAQGTTGCVAFARGAEWYRDQLLATGLHTLYKTNDPEAPATIRARNGEVVLSLCKVCGKAEGELGEPCHAPAVAEGWTDADSDAARLALELECLLMDTKDLSVVSKWWGSANEALELHRQRLAAAPATTPSGFAKALDIRISQGWKLTGNTIPVLYTDTINGDQVMRDDVWLCTTSALEVEAPAPAQEVGLTEAQTTHVRTALQHAWQLGQVYWQQADSNYTSEHKKSDETQQDFEKFCDDIIAALRAKGGK